MKAILPILALLWSLVAPMMAATLDPISLHVAGPALQPWPRWNGQPVVASRFPYATIFSTATVASPSGAAVTEGSLSSHRYRLQNQLHYDTRTDRLYIVWTSGGVSEDTGGQQIAYAYSDDLGVTWSTPAVMIPSQSDFDTVGAAAFAPIGDRAAMCWRWIEDDGDLFYVSSIQGLQGGFEDDLQGLALLAREVNEDGSLGTLYRISTNAYAAVDGKASVSFDQTLHDRLYQRVRFTGFIGGSAPGASIASDWVGFVAVSTNVAAEFASVQTGATEATRVQIARTFGDGDPRVMARTTTNLGTNWTSFIRTDVPSGDQRTFTWKSASTMLELPDGGFLIGGSFTTNRQDYYVARTDPWLRVTNVVLTFTNIAAGPTYAGVSKGGGVGYGSLAVFGTNAWSAAATTKERIIVKRYLQP